MAAERLCNIDGCSNAFYARGWCHAHYQRWWKHGDPHGGALSPGEAVQYFYAVVAPYEDDECLIWPYTNVRGYGMLHMDGRNHYVSRLLCEIVHGPPPSPKHEAAHLCGKGSKGCVTKHHLVWKTQSENEQDRIAHGTRNWGERCGTSKLKTHQILEIRRLAGTMSQRAMAAKFGISQAHVSDIVCRRKWAWLE